jgi:hypothetical protein
MPITPADRPIDALREEVVDQLIANYGHGRLSLEAFQRRLDEAYEAERHDVLAGLVADLDPISDGEVIEQKRAALLDPGPQGDLEPERLISIFGGTGRKGSWRVPGEIRAVAIFGGIDLDFSEATFTCAITRVKLMCLFGGVDIRVPEGVRTSAKTIAIFGGVDDKTPACDDPQGPRLVIEGVVLFGGADIRLKRTLKERALAVADRLRAHFGG